MRVDGQTLNRWWGWSSRLPGGRWLFTRLLFTLVPYSGTAGARIESLAPGRVELILPDRRRIRNHLGSIHAIALTNVAELASGLSLITCLDTQVRAIVVGLEMDFLKKARGSLRIEGTASPPDVDVDSTIEYVARASIRDGSGETVARGRVRWRLGRPSGVRPATPDP